MSNFAFLQPEFPAIHEAAVEAERQAKSSPTAAAFFAGKTVEIAVKWAFRNDPGLTLPYQDNIAALLQIAIPGIAAQARLIEEIQRDPWWEGLTVPLLELVRLRLRDLVQHIGRQKRAIVYSNFADELGVETEHELPQVGEIDFVRFKQKARAFLKAHEDHIALHKLRQGKPLTPTDLAELEAMLLDAGIGDAETIERARVTSEGFGRFVRSLVGLDRQAVSAAFAEFLADGTATAEQIEFINMIVEHLTECGVMEPDWLYESPFIDVAPQGPENVFDMQRTDRLFEVIQEINGSAVA